MEALSHANTFWSLIPPALAIFFAILTHRVILSLAIGIFVGALIGHDFVLFDTVIYLFWLGVGLFTTDDGLIDWEYVWIIAFLLGLGIFAAFLTLAGGVQAFSRFAAQRIKTKRQARLMTMLLGVMIFIDDYFNCLAVGNISRPVTDSHEISRANLAYIIDGTVAPVCSMAPISSWGAYIIAIIGSILLFHGITDISAFGAFIQIVTMNFYAWFALLMVLVVSVTAWHVGPMLKHDQWARQGQLYDPNKGEPMGAVVGLPESYKGGVWDLVIPMLVLVIAIVVGFFVTGYRSLVEQGQAFSWLQALEHTVPGAALFSGCLVGLAVITIILLSKKVKLRDGWRAVRVGLRAMLPAVYILLFAWSIATVVSDLETGNYLAGMTNDRVNVHWLPAILFIIAGLTTFSTGTSWGTFALLLPIAGEMAMAAEPLLFLPCLAAVLSGALWGDHASPISDTTILASTGAGCHHIDHVITQLSYTMMIALVALVGFMVLGFTRSVGLSLLSCMLIFLLMMVVLFARVKLERARALSHAACD